MNPTQIPLFAYNHPDRLKLHHNEEHPTAMTPSTAKYPYCQLNSGMSWKFIP